MEVFFESIKNILESFREGVIPGSIRGLTFRTRVLEIEASASYTRTEVQVAVTEEEYGNVVGCIGLRIRRKGEEKDSWTIATHA